MGQHAPPPEVGHTRISRTSREADLLGIWSHDPPPLHLPPRLGAGEGYVVHGHRLQQPGGGRPRASDDEVECGLYRCHPSELLCERAQDGPTGMFSGIAFCAATDPTRSSRAHGVVGGLNPKRRREGTESGASEPTASNPADGVGLSRCGRREALGHWGGGGVEEVDEGTCAECSRLEGELSRLVIEAGAAQGQARCELRKLLCKCLRRIVRINARRNSITSAQRCSEPNRVSWPTTHGRPLQDSASGLAAFARGSKAQYVRAAEGQTRHSSYRMGADSLSWCVASAKARRESEGLAKWGCWFAPVGRRRHRSLAHRRQRLVGRRPQPSSEHGARLPPPSSRSRHHWALQTTAPLQFPGLLEQRADGLEPLWLCAQGFVRGGDVGAHIQTATMLAEEGTAS